MCCFRLHLSDFNALFKKNLLQFNFDKITCCAKGEKKITCREEKSQPPPWISNGPSLCLITNYAHYGHATRHYKEISNFLIRHKNIIFPYIAGILISFFVPCTYHSRSDFISVPSPARGVVYDRHAHLSKF